MLYVKEKFESICGEGFQMGMPALFVRFAGCNLNCSWCDEDWGFNNHVKKINLFRLEDEINHYKGFGSISHESANIVLTGGEPFNQNYRSLSRLLKNFSHAGVEKIIIETNGMKQPTGELGLTIAELKDMIDIVISPKPPSAFKHKPILEMASMITEVNDTIQVWKDEFDYGNIYWKFVVDGSSYDMVWLDSVLSEYLNCCDDRISIQAVDNDPEITEGIVEFINLINKNEGFNADLRMVPQVHKYMNMR